MTSVEVVKTISIDTLGGTIKIPAFYEINEKYHPCMYGPGVWHILTLFRVEHYTVILYNGDEDYEIVIFPLCNYIWRSSEASPRRGGRW